ncbi:sugar ABC transporter substrate-binding protein [Streptomyces sp. NPDC056470]|uniref:sugar ABC transporter substrate-binding protein n=1 Tax=Streptomyces sp. NPDC056470 TaxID=3345831 RepID=UPI0036D003E1
MLAALAMGGVSGCGGSGGGGGNAGDTDRDGVAQAQAVVAEYLKPMKWQAPGPAFKPADNLDGTVYIVPNTTKNYFFQQVIGGLTEAAGVFGMDVVAVETEGKISEAARGIREAVGRKAAAIVIGSLQSQALAQPIKEATAAGIPVITMFDKEEVGEQPQPNMSALSPEQAALGIFGDTEDCNTCMGRALAALAVAQSGGNANAVSIMFPEIPPSKYQSAGFLGGMKEFCPNCKTKETGFPISEVGTQLGPATSAALSDPKVNYLVPVFNFMVPMMTPVINAAGAAARATVITQGSDPEVLKMIKSGKLGGLVASPDGWFGWNAFDQVLRALSGQPPAQDSYLPSRLITKENIDSIDINAPQAAWFGVDYRSELKKLWGLSQ